LHARNDYVILFGHLNMSFIFIGKTENICLKFLFGKFSIHKSNLICLRLSLSQNIDFDIIKKIQKINTKRYQTKIDKIISSQENNITFNPKS